MLPFRGIFFLLKVGRPVMFENYFRLLNSLSVITLEETERVNMLRHRKNGDSPKLSPFKFSI